MVSMLAPLEDLLPVVDLFDDDAQQNAKLRLKFRSTVQIDPYKSFNLRPQQRHGVEFLERVNGCGGLFMEMRTGKTRTALAYLHDKANTILIVSQIMGYGVWIDEISLFAEYKDFSILPLSEGSNQARAVTLRQAASVHDKLIVLVNYESFWREDLRLAILAWNPDAVITDEAQHLRHHTSKQSKFAHTLAKTKYRIALTGTPFPRGNEDAYSLFRFINPSVFGTSWGRFCRRYIRMGGYLGHEIKGYENEDEFRDKIAANSYRVTRKESFPTTAPQHIPTSVTLNSTTGAAYEKLKRDGLTQVQSLVGESGTVVSKMAMTTIMRLQQITSGFAVVDDDKSERLALNISSEKIDAATAIVQDVLDEGESVVVFCRFIRDLERLSSSLTSLKIDYGILRGGMARILRESTLRQFQSGVTHVLVAQQHVASTSIDLSAANTAIFVSTMFSLDDFTQARDRLRGPNQTKVVGYYYLLGMLPNGKPTVDKLIYSTLARRIRLSKSIIDNPRLAAKILST